MLEFTRTQTVLVVRGLPGSGKSHWVEAQDFPQGWTYCSADKFYMVDGQYRYNKSRQGEAHAFCLEEFLIAIEKESPCIVVDNTCSREWEYKNYLRIARMHGYTVQIIEITCQHRTMAKVFASRNSHGVPEDVVVGMFERWEQDGRAKLVYPGFATEEEARIRHWVKETQILNARIAMIGRRVSEIKCNFSMPEDTWEFKHAIQHPTTFMVVVTYWRPNVQGHPECYVEFPIMYLYMDNWEDEARKQSKIPTLGG